MQTKCYFCTQEITGLVEYHHHKVSDHILSQFDRILHFRQRLLYRNTS